MTHTARADGTWLDVLQTSTSPRILLINDSPDEHEMYADWFERQGMLTLHADSAADGFRLASETPPAAVVTDVRLSGGEDGFELTRRIKADDRLRDVPVVILTGYVVEGSRTAAAGVGCDLFVTKPCLPDDLLSLLVELMRKRT